MNRRMSHALEIRSTLMPVRVTQVAPRTGEGRRARRAGHRPLRRRAARGVEPVDPFGLLQAPPEPRQLVVGGLAAPGQRARVTLDGGVVGVTLDPEHGFDLLVVRAGKQGAAAQRGLAALRLDLARQPLEVLPGLRPSGQEVNGVLEGDGTEPLEAAADLHPEVVGFGRDLVDQEEPVALRALAPLRRYHN